MKKFNRSGRFAQLDGLGPIVVELVELVLEALDGLWSVWRAAAQQAQVAVLPLTFDNFFIKDRTLFQVGANVLYDVPIGASFLYPYVGVGVGLTRFALPETDGRVMSMPGSPRTPPVVDSNGMRIGLNLIGGVRFQHVGLPLVRPFLQVMGSLGPIDLFSVVGGMLFQLSGG